MEFFFIAILAGSFILTYILTPKIIDVIRYKNLMDAENLRSSHKNSVPTLGGIAFYISLMIGFYFIKSFDSYHYTDVIIPGLLILFFIGLKDDLVVLSPYTKLIAQILACLFVVLNNYFQLSPFSFTSTELITNYDMMFVIFTLILMVFVINTVNFIDGIDGLATGICLIIFSFYIFLFSQTNEVFMMALYTILIGSLLAFLKFNLSKMNKIFMGDTGSLILGFMVALGLVRLAVIGKTNEIDLPFSKIQFYLILLSVVFVPLYDSSRVIIIRILNKKSPFFPDRNHIHHLLLDRFKLNHGRTTLIIIWFNLLLIFTTILINLTCSPLNSIISFCLIVLIISFVLYRFKKKLNDGKSTNLNNQTLVSELNQS